MIGGELRVWSQQGQGTRLSFSIPEIEILTLIAEGKSSKEIADLLSISIMTVYNHRINIKSKLKLKRNADLVKYAIHKGYTAGF